MRNFAWFALFFIAFLINNFYCSFVNADTITEIREDLQILGQKGVIGSDVYSTINLNDFSTYSKYAIIIGQGSKNENYSYPLKLSTTKYLYIIANNGNTIGNFSNTTNNQLYYNWSNINKCNWYNINTGAKVSSGNFLGNDLIQPYYIFTTVSINTREIQLDANSEYGGTYLTQQFVFNARGSNVDVNDYNNVNAIKVNYSYIVLGNVVQYLDDYDYYKYVLFDSGGSIVSSIQTKKGQDWYWGNDGMEYYYGTETIEIQRRIIYLKEIYTLSIYMATQQINQENSNIEDSYVITYIFLPNNAVINGGQITDPGSGDSYSTQDSTNDTIGFIQNLYDDLFKPSSGDLEEVKSVAYSFIPSGDTPLTVLDTIFGSLNNDPDDFIIRWDNIALNFSLNDGSNNFSGDFIAANYINFSKLCRENSTFGQVKFWINILSVIGFLSAYIWTYYQGVLMILGVSTEFVNTEPEHREIGFIQGGRQ